MAQEHDLFDDIIEISKGFDFLKNPLGGVTDALDPSAPQWNPADYKERPRGNTIPCLTCKNEKSGCTACMDVCPVNAIEVEEDAIEILDSCRKCGLCAAAKGLFLLTMKPILYVANVDEDMLNDDLAPIDGVKPLPICAKIEAELSELDPEDAADYLESLGLEQPGLDVLAQAAYKLLGLQSFFTAGEMEVKAWTVRQGATAPQAAGVIHTDFERGFIKAEVIGYDDYIELGGEQGAKAAGKLRIEGKDYVMADGDVVHFRFNV